MEKNRQIRINPVSHSCFPKSVGELLIYNLCTFTVRLKWGKQVMHPSAMIVCSMKCLNETLHLLIAYRVQEQVYWAIHRVLVPVALEWVAWKIQNMMLFGSNDANWHGWELMRRAWLERPKRQRKQCQCQESDDPVEHHSPSPSDLVITLMWNAQPTVSTWLLCTCVPVI